MDRRSGCCDCIEFQTGGDTMLFSSLLRGRAARRSCKVRPPADPTPRHTSCLETLETRRLLAADPGGVAALNAGVLQVTGTRKADEIHVDLNATTSQLDVTINGTS